MRRRAYFFLILLVFTSALLPPLSTGVQAVPPEFQINTTTTGNQSAPAIGMNGLGRFVVV